MRISHRLGSLSGTLLAVGIVATFLVYRASEPPHLSSVSCQWIPKGDGVATSGKVTNPSPLPASFVIRLHYSITGIGAVNPDTRVYVSTLPFETRHWRTIVGAPQAVVGSAITSCAPTVRTGSRPDDD